MGWSQPTRSVTGASLCLSGGGTDSAADVDSWVPLFWKTCAHSVARTLLSWESHWTAGPPIALVPVGGLGRSGRYHCSGPGITHHLASTWWKRSRWWMLET